jgi:hypothetical protein
MAEPITYNIHGCYICSYDGKKYQYYGRCISGGGANWEARVFDHDKKFQTDSALESKDTLVILSGPLISGDQGFSRELALQQVEYKIEEWASGKTEDA